MDSIWKTIKIKELIDKGEAELVTGPFGTQLHASDYVETGTPVINARNIGFGDIREDKLEYIAEETVQRLSRHLLEPEDIVFGRKGAVERHAFIRENHTRWFQGSDCLRVRFNSPAIVPRFVSYYFLTDFHKAWMINHCSHGATMASLNQAIVSNIPLPFPPPDTQRRIADILSAYDDLIANNNRRMALLEESLHLLYREWFVRLRFPGHERVKIVDGVPEGWSRRVVEDFGEVITGKTPSTKIEDYYGGEIPFIKIPDMHGNVFITETGTTLTELGADSQKKKYLPKYSLIMSCIGTVGLVGITSTVSQTNQQINSLIPKEEYFLSYCYFALKQLKPHLIGIGSKGATFGNVNKKEFSQSPMIMPNLKILKDFEIVSRPVFDQILNLQIINQRLHEARDMLLPRLMNGDIIV